MKAKQELTLEFFKKQGARGGKMGGALAWAGLTAEQRSERAKKAVAARKWHPVKVEETAAPATKRARKRKA